MQVMIEPPMSGWQVGRGGGPARAELAQITAANADRLGRCLNGIGPVIATGHQAWLWHPGILAKDLAAQHAAELHNAQTLHVVVDQDVSGPMRLQIPVVDQGRAGVQVIEIGEVDTVVATCCQGPLNTGRVVQRLDATRQRFGKTLAVDLGVIAEAFEDLPDCQTLAQQITVVLARLRAAMIDGWQPMPIVFASDLVKLTVFQDLIDRMAADAQHCVEQYNHAVAAHPDAGVVPLGGDRDRVELPLWWLSWGRVRQRVFAEITSKRNAELVLENGERIEAGAWKNAAERKTGNTDESAGTLAPRALLMTAVLRRWCCDYFIHGRGGNVYDRITDQWWRTWLGEELSPTAMVTADVTLGLGVPVADEIEARRAVWRAHHTQHNVDRAIQVEGQATDLANRKQYLISHMDDDRDRTRRAAAFAEIHQINDQLRRAYPDVVLQAQDKLQQAQLGVTNQAVAGKRDWCFALYERKKIREVVGAMGSDQ